MAAHDPNPTTFHQQMAMAMAKAPPLRTHPWLWFPLPTCMIIDKLLHNNEPILPQISQLQDSFIIFIQFHYYVRP